MPTRRCDACGKERDVRGGKHAQMDILYAKSVFMAQGSLMAPVHHVPYAVSP